MSIVAATGKLSMGEIIRDDRGLLGLVEQEMEYQADLRRLAEPTVETPGRFVDVASGFEEMEWSE